MLANFMNLEPEKQERIINAALAEFAKKTYKNASTNEIVKKAGISKGILFHYFKNKKSLFLYLLDYSVNIFVNEFYNQLDDDETDIIKRLRQIALLKIDLIQKHPDLYEFLLASTMDDSSEMKQDIACRYESIIADFYKRLLANLDTSGYREGLDTKRVSEMITWVVQGFSNSELEKLKHHADYKSNFDLDAIMAEFDAYMDLLKGAFYK